MRTSVLSRSLIATAGLAAASVTLSAVPASAAPSDITRQQVLAAASAVRAEPSPSALLISSTTSRALRVLTNRACSIDPDGDEFAVLSLSEATAAGQSVDGVVVTALVVKADVANLITSITAIEAPPAGVEIGDFLRLCSFGVLAPTAGSSTLTGTATIGGEAPAQFAISGEVFVTPPTNTTDFSFITGPVSPTDAEDPEDPTDPTDPTEAIAAIIAPTFAATGNAVRTFDVPATSMVSTPKTAAQKKAAKKAYDKKLKSAKAAYAKAAKKAGSSKAKKKAAKKAHAAKRAAAKAAYQQAIAASSQPVASTTKSSESSPFSVTAQVDLSTLLDFPQVPPVE